MKLTKETATALVRGLGAFLIDHAELAAEYVVAASGNPAEPAAVTAMAVPPEIRPGPCTLTVHRVDSADPVVVECELRSLEPLPDGTVAYALHLKTKDLIAVGSRDIFAPAFFVNWSDGALRLASPLSPLVEEAYRVELEPRTVDQKAVAE